MGDLDGLEVRGDRKRSFLAKRKTDDNKERPVVAVSSFAGTARRSVTTETMSLETMRMSSAGIAFPCPEATAA